MANVEKRISKEGEVSYRITVCSGYGSDGKKIRHRMTFRPDKTLTERQADKAAQKEAFLFEQKLEQGFILDDNQRFSEYAAYVLDLKFRNGLKRSTYERYLTLMPKINKAIGGYRLRDIRPMQLNEFYKSLSQPGVREDADRAVAVKDIASILKSRHITKTALSEMAGIAASTVSVICQRRPVRRTTAEAVSKAMGMPFKQLFRSEKNAAPLSNKTVLEYHRLIGTILAQAEKEMLVPYNAARKATPPKCRRKEVNHFQPEEVRRILEVLRSEPLKWQLTVHLLMITGARRGEIAGLKWSKFDFDKQRLLIDEALLISSQIGVYEADTKTDNRRYIPLPDETFALLKKYRAWQTELRLKNGDRWTETDYVSPGMTGGRSVRISLLRGCQISVSATTSLTSIPTPFVIRRRLC